jgi:hypothetical protein
MFPPIVRKTFGLNRRFFLIFEPLLASAQLIIACVTAYFILSVAADAQIVALGASDVAGWFGVLHHQTWPTQLEEMLKANGYNVYVKNAGKPGDTPWGLLHRLDSAVPSGTKIVILAKEGLYGNNQLSQLKADRQRPLKRRWPQGIGHTPPASRYQGAWKPLPKRIVRG